MMTYMPAGEGLAVTQSREGHDGYARIGEVAREFGVTLRALRFYEDKGLIHPRRVGTTRLYTHRDTTRVRLILLGRKIGFTLRDVKHILDLYEPGGTNARQLKLLLQKSERQMVRLEKQRVALDQAMGDLGELIADVRGRLGKATGD